MIKKAIALIVMGFMLVAGAGCATLGNGKLDIPGLEQATPEDVYASGRLLGITVQKKGNAQLTEDALYTINRVMEATPESIKRILTEEVMLFISDYFAPGSYEVLMLMELGRQFGITDIDAVDDNLQSIDLCLVKSFALGVKHGIMLAMGTPEPYKTDFSDVCPVDPVPVQPLEDQVR